jgi:hypothetical protein
MPAFAAQDGVCEAGRQAFGERLFASHSRDDFGKIQE